MYGHMTGWAWLWMTIMSLSCFSILGLVIYVAVKLANRNSATPKRPLRH